MPEFFTPPPGTVFYDFNTPEGRREFLLVLMKRQTRRILSDDARRAALAAKRKSPRRSSREPDPGPGESPFDFPDP